MEVALTSFIARPMHMQLVKESGERLMMKIVRRKNMSACTRLERPRFWWRFGLQKGCQKVMDHLGTDQIAFASNWSIVCNLMMQLHLPLEFKDTDEWAYRTDPYYLVIVYYLHCFCLQNAITFNSRIHVLRLILSIYELIFHWYLFPRFRNKVAKEPVQPCDFKTKCRNGVPACLAGK